MHQDWLVLRVSVGLNPLLSAQDGITDNLINRMARNLSIMGKPVAICSGHNSTGGTYKLASLPPPVTVEL